MFSKNKTFYTKFGRSHVLYTSGPASEGIPETMTINYVLFVNTLTYDLRTGVYHNVFSFSNSSYDITVLYWQEYFMIAA